MRLPILQFGVGLIGLVAIGCASSSHWSSNKTPATPGANAQAADVAPVAAPPSAAKGTGSPSPQDMAAAMAELQQIGNFDPAAQQRLMADLQETDPSLWPLMIQQVRASVAFCRRTEERDRLAQRGPAPQGISDPLAGPTSSVGEAAAFAPDARLAPSPTVTRLPPPSEVAPPASRPVAPLGEPQPPLDVMRRADSDRPTVEAPARKAEVRQASYLEASEEKEERKTEEKEPTKETKEEAKEEAKTSRELLDAAIRQFETEAPKRAETADEVSRVARLRLLHLAAGNREAALEPVPEAAPATQEFLKSSVYGIDKWLDVSRTPDEPRRLTETKQALEEAVGKLGTMAPLAVRNLAFCYDISSYGCYKAFKANEFAPDQEVLLYAEVDNFASESTAKGYHTSLRSSYQIYDARGRCVADHDCAVTEEHCRNMRRDFFIPFHLRLPARIYPGKHTLQLTIEDLTSQKTGQSQIEFTIAEASPSKGSKK